MPKRGIHAALHTFTAVLRNGATVEYQSIIKAARPMRLQIVSAHPLCGCAPCMQNRSLKVPTPPPPATQVFTTARHGRTPQATRTGQERRARWTRMAGQRTSCASLGRAMTPVPAARAASSRRRR